jgi:hypothetical protein
MCYSYFCHQSASYRSCPDGFFPSTRIASPCCPWQLPVHRRSLQQRPVLELFVFVATFIVAVATTCRQTIVFGLTQVPFQFSLASVRSARALSLGDITKCVRLSGHSDGVMVSVNPTLQPHCDDVMVSVNPPTLQPHCDGVMVSVSPTLQPHCNGVMVSVSPTLQPGCGQIVTLCKSDVGLLAR